MPYSHNVINHSRYMALAEDMADLGYWSYDIDNDDLKWSAKIYEIHGVKPDEYTPEIDTAIGFYHPLDRDRVTTLVDNAIKQGKDFKFELRIIRADKVIRYVKAAGECVFDDDKLVSVIGVFQDITDFVIPSSPKKLDFTYPNYLMSQDGYWDWYIQDDYEYMSPRFWEIFGYLPDEMPHRPSSWQQLILPEDLKVCIENFERHVESKGTVPFEVEARYKHKNGSIMTVLCRGNVIEWGSNGEPIRMVGTHTDISDLKEVQQNLRATKEQYELAVQGSSVGIWDWNAENETLYCSPRCREILGLLDQQYEKNPGILENLIYSEDKENALDSFSKSLTEKSDLNIELRVNHPEKEILWVNIRGTAVYDDQGDVLRMAGSVDDITEKKLNSMELEQSLAFQNLLLDVNTDPIFVKDSSYRIVQANPAFLSFYPEEKRDQVIGTTTFEDYDPEEVKGFLQEDKKAFLNGYSEVEETVNFPNGVKKTLWMKKIRFLDIDKNRFIIGIGRDITKLKQVEQKLVEANSELEEFAYRTSHDIRSPLVSSKKLLELVNHALREGDIDKVEDYTRLVIGSLGKLEKLVQDILNFTRIKHTDENLSEINIERVIVDSLEKFSHMEGVDTIDITYRLENAKPIISQKEHIDLIIENLISNAIKYQDPEKENSHLTIEAETEGDFHIIRFVDNGLGIPKHHLNKLFTMFKRFHPRTSFGSGLGLYMVKKSVEFLGGDISYETQADGSAFIIQIPDSKNQT